jgi:hypothetical protein
MLDHTAADFVSAFLNCQGQQVPKKALFVKKESLGTAKNCG